MKKLTKFSCMILMAFLITMFTIPVYAGGVAAGSGGGADVPLHMRDCSLKNGQKDVPTDVQITLYYSHNVADAAVQKNNSAAIHMTGSDGKSISLSVSYSGSFEYRQEIYVKPSGLLPGTTYVLTVEPNLMAKNGYTTGTTDTITFTTVKQSDSFDTIVSNEGTDSGNQSNKTGTSQSSSETKGNTTTGTASQAASETQSAGTGSQKQDTAVSNSVTEVAGTVDTEFAKAAVQEAETEDSEDVTEETEQTDMSETLEDDIMEGDIMEEADEMQIVKVSDKKPGRVETSDPETEYTEADSAKAWKLRNTVILVVVVAAGGVALYLVYYRIRKHRK